VTEGGVDPATSNCQVGYEPENVLALNPSRPLKFTTSTSTEKQFVFIFSTSYAIDCVAVIEPHSNFPLAGLGDIQTEDRMNFRLERASGTVVFDWTELSDLQTDNWGTNFFRSFNSTTDQRWILKVRREGGSLGDASIGAILLGRKLTFPSNPLITYNRSVLASSVFSGRPQGPATVYMRDNAARTVNIRVRCNNEDERIAIERLMAGRGRRRATNNEAVRKRLDLPTVLVSPDMWVDTTNTYGSCIFGRFTGGMTSQSYVGGAAMVDLVFQEMV
jgi:hypothetical protein